MRRVLTCTLVLLGSAARADEPVNLADYYGFGPLEIFKLEERSQGMVAGDLNGDGKTDLVLIDNSHSRLDLLVQRDKAADADAEPDSSDVNAVKNDWRFKHEKLSVDEEIGTVALGDFNGDGKTDVAYLGTPDRLVVRYQSDGDTPPWSERHTVRLPDVTASAWVMAAGDLNGDKRTDLAVLGKTATYLILQQEDGKLAPPEPLMNTAEKLGLAQVADVDGDGRNDLCYTAEDEEGRVLCVRRQSADGTLGPELQFDLNRPRSLSVGEVDGQPGAELLVVDSRTNRVKVLQVRPGEADDDSLPRPIQYGFGESGSGRDRDMATGDLDGDRLTDVVVSSPTAAQVLVYRQRKGSGLGLAESFPSLTGVTQVRTADFDGDGRAEVLVLSTKEKTLGVSRFEDGRLTFPTALPLDTEPLATEVADLDGDGRLDVLCVVAGTERGQFEFRVLTLSKGGKWLPARKLGEAVTLPGTPERLVKVDANQDGRPDFLTFFSLGRLPVVLVTNEQGVPELVQPAGGIQLGDVAAGAVFVQDADRRGALLVARDGFARRLTLGDKQWAVEDQYNATEAGAQIVGVAALDLDGQPGDEVVLVDRGVKRLRVLRRDESLYRPWKEVEIGNFPFIGTRTADLNGDGKEDLVLLGRGRFAVLYSGGAKVKVEELASFETKLEKVLFADAVAGDLNGDGQTDLAVVDVRSAYVEILAYDPTHGLRHALHFRVFEQKSFADAGGSGLNPREALVVDVTGDGRKDLVLLSQDRVLLYPQDTGLAEPEASAKK